MAEKKQLAIYWGDHSFCFVEVEKGKLLKSLSVPFSSPIDTYQSQDVPEGLRFTTLIQKALRDLNISSKRVSLSLPAKDIIFRSFVIPWMEPEEVKNVVDFEAIKYIPIKLEDLSYTYYSIPINENNQKNLRILFVAIRKDVLSRYIGVLEHAGLNVDWAEPSPMSLVRVLEQKGQISQSHGCAIVQIEQQGGKIIFVDHNIVQFVREFQLPAWEEKNLGDLEIFTSRLFNEIRVSINFYSRQNPQGKITKIIALSLRDIPQLTKSLTEAMNIPSILLTVPVVLKSSSANEVGVLNAFGCGLRDKKSVLNNFNLLLKAGQLKSGGTGLSLEESKYKMVAVIVALATALVGGFFLLTKNMNASYKVKLATLKSQQGAFVSTPTADIKKLEEEAASKLNAYKDIQIKSTMAHYLARLPQILPSGTWLKDWDFDYVEKRVTGKDEQTSRTISRLAIGIEGYAYLDDTNEQFRLVSSLLAKLKNTKDIADSFDNIDLVSVRQEAISNYPVTSFRITFK